MGYWIITAYFAVLEALVLAGVFVTGRRGQNALRYTLSSTSVICLWLFWSIAYLAQINPLVNPEAK